MQPWTCVTVLWCASSRGIARARRAMTMVLPRAQAFADSGATWMHLVDLDAAKAGGYTLAPLLRQITVQQDSRCRPAAGCVPVMMLCGFLTQARHVWSSAHWRCARWRVSLSGAASALNGSPSHWTRAKMPVACGAYRSWLGRGCRGNVGRAGAAVCSSRVAPSVVYGHCP